MAYRYIICISYDGSQYKGWQRQHHQNTIQQAIETALNIVIKTPNSPIVIIGAGRTDAGVHANGQIAHFTLPQPINNISKTLYSINSLLPSDIRIRSLTSTSNDFHARYSAKRKIYHYSLHLNRISNPFTHKYTTPIYTSFDISLVRKALPYLIGTHDFSTFRSSKCESKQPIKTLFDISLIEICPESVKLIFEGSGFLYKMVRNITGTLIEIGNKKRSYTEIPQLLAAKNRQCAGPTAPSQGLCLYEIQY